MTNKCGDRCSHTMAVLLRAERDLLQPDHHPFQYLLPVIPLFRRTPIVAYDCFASPVTSLHANLRTHWVLVGAEVGGHQTHSLVRRKFQGSCCSTWKDLACRES
jgi:hypothetical protein